MASDTERGGNRHFRRSALLQPRINEDYVEFARGEGIYLFDSSGTRYIDASSGAVVCNIGHGVRPVIEAMTKQATALEYMSRLQGSSEAARDLANRLRDSWAPDGAFYSWFSSSGSDAIEAAIRIARQYHVDRGATGRYKIVSTWQSYHGSTLGALAASGREGPRQNLQPYFANAWPHIEGPYCYRCPFGLDATVCGAKCAEQLESIVAKEGADAVAAFVIEPIVGTTTGGTHPPEDYFRRVKDICGRYGILLIVDEVMSGFGRTGRRFAVDHWNCVPDIIVSGKGLGSGYAPVFVTMAHERIVDAIAAGSGEIGLGNTYNANPLSCAVASAVLSYVEEHDLVQRAAQMGEQLHRSLQALYDIDIVGDVRGLGLMQGVELVQDVRSRRAFPKELNVASRIGAAARELGMLVTHRGATSDGSRGDHVFITPPLVVTEDEIATIARIVGEAILLVRNELAA